MGFLTNIEVLIKSVTSKKEIADLEREFLQSKESAEKAFNTAQVTQTSFSEIDACRYFVEKLIPQGKKDFYCCIQEDYSRSSVDLLPSSYNQEITLLQNQNSNDEKAVKKAKQKILSCVYSTIKNAREDKVLHKTYTIVGYTDDKDYADKWGRSSTNPIANKTDEELYRLWDSISHKDKVDILSERIGRNCLKGDTWFIIVRKIIELGNPFSQYGMASPLYQIALWQGKKGVSVFKIAAAILVQNVSLIEEAATSPESLDLSATTQLDIIQQALIIREKLGLDFIPILKNGTLWKSVEDMRAAANSSIATNDCRLEYQGQLITFGDAKNIAICQAQKQIEQAEGDYIDHRIGLVEKSQIVKSLKRQISDLNT